LVGIIIAARMNDDRPTPQISHSQLGNRHGSFRKSFLVHYQYWKITAMALSFWALVASCIRRVEMAARGNTRSRFTSGPLVAAFWILVNMETVGTGRKSRQTGDKPQTVFGVYRSDLSDFFADAIRTDGSYLDRNIRTHGRYRCDRNHGT
jgi:hypothetical protein